MKHYSPYKKLKFLEGTITTYFQVNNHMDRIEEWPTAYPTLRTPGLTHHKRDVLFGRPYETLHSQIPLRKQ